MDEVWSEEHIQNIQRTKLEIDLIVARGETFSLNILIDDYNSTEDKLVLDEFITNLKNLGICPDNVIFESDLVALKEDLFLKISDERVIKQYRRYIFTKDKVPCSFLIAVWYGVRLGLIRNQELPFYVKNHEKSLVGKKLINVLHSRYDVPEGKANKIIAKTHFSSRIVDIENIYVN
jgi:hypothetical protein